MEMDELPPAGDASAAVGGRAAETSTVGSSPAGQPTAEPSPSPPKQSLARRIKRFVKQNSNLLLLHATYFLVLSLVGTLGIWSVEPSYGFVDAFFTAVAALTSGGLTVRYFPGLADEGTFVPRVATYPSLQARS